MEDAVKHSRTHIQKLGVLDTALTHLKKSRTTLWRFAAIRKESKED
jgi:hypothetical protein